MESCSDKQRHYPLALEDQKGSTALKPMTVTISQNTHHLGGSRFVMCKGTTKMYVLVDFIVSTIQHLFFVVYE